MLILLKQRRYRNEIFSIHTLLYFKCDQIITSTGGVVIIIWQTIHISNALGRMYDVTDQNIMRFHHFLRWHNFSYKEGYRVFQERVCWHLLYHIFIVAKINENPQAPWSKTACICDWITRILTLKNCFIKIFVCIEIH